MAYVFQEFPKALYKNGVPSATANDRDEQEALIADGYELPPANEPEPVPCDGCAEREARIQDLEAQLAALIAKRGRKGGEPEPPKE